MKRVIVIIIAVVSSILMIASFSMIGCKADAAVTEEAAAGTEVEEESTEGTEVEETKVEETSALEVTPGTQINVFVDGGINSFPFEQVIDEIKNETGIEVVLTPVAQADVYTKLKNEFISGTGAFDLVVYFPSLLPEFVNLGNLLPMDEYVGVLDPKTDDIIDSYRELYCNYDGKLYSLPYDGDLHMYYYRKDLVGDATEQENFKERYGYDLSAPQTWAQAKDYAEFFTRKAGETLAGQTLENDFYGNGMLLGRGWCHFEWMDHFAGLGGIYFDEDLNPMINGEAGLQALAEMKELMAFAPEGILSYGYSENRGGFLSGNLASMILWTGAFKYSYNEDESAVAGKVGMSHVPGYIVDGELTFKSTMPFGRVMSITSTTEHPIEAFWVASYMSAYKSIDFTFDPRAGEDPFRYSHVEAADKLAEYLSDFSGKDVEVEDCEIYFSGIKDGLENGYPDLSIPGSSEYMDILDLNIHKALSGEISNEEALDNVAEEWMTISESLGFDSQKAIWQSQLSTWEKLGLIK